MRTPLRAFAATRRAALLAGVLSAAALASPAGAAAGSLVSSNWAGYVARSGAAGRFESVSGSWKVPAVSCTPGAETHSAVWVGLGGYRERATGLEQIGTGADCTASGRPSYTGWVELLPAGAQTLRLKVSPGDQIIASVTVIGRHATLRLRDLTTGRRFSATRTLENLDVSSAEWIVEAPSGCSSAGACETLALSDFSTVAFEDATARTASLEGTAADTSWPVTSLVLEQPRTTGRASSARGALVSATPSTLSGGSFTVSYGFAAGAQAPEAPALSGGAQAPSGSTVP